MKVYLHVNYYEGPGKYDKLFEIADKYGYDGIELRWKYSYNDMDQTAYQQKIIELKDQYPNLELSFGGMVDFLIEDRNQVKSETEAYLEFLEWAKANCGTHVMNFFTGGMVRSGADYYEFDRNGSGMAEDIDYARSADGLKIVGDKAAELGILISLETHNCYLHDLPKSCARLMKATAHDAVGINLDMGNIVINKNGSDPEEAIDIIGEDKIYYAHLKNVLMYKKELFMSTRLEEGHIDNTYILERIGKTVKSGVVAVEYACPGDGIIAAKRDMEYVKFMRDWLKI
jgi:sugar phosphate isomerase/epimerase